MKINIGPYTTWWGPYQIAELLCFWAKGKDKYGITEYPDWVHNFGERLSKTWLRNVCEWVENRKRRKIKIQIDKYDTWGVDSTLSLIIAPMLIQLRDTTHGYPADFVKDESDWTGQRNFEGEGFEFPDDEFEQWQATLDKMIWAFEQVNTDWKEQYTTGHIDFYFKPCEDNPNLSTMEHGPDHTYEADYDAMRRHEAKMQEGFDLFAKYFRGLWD